MKTSYLNQNSLPAVIEHNDSGESGSNLDSLFNMYTNHRDVLHRKLLESGALLLRGFPPLDVPEFARFVHYFSGKETLDYVGGASPRIKLGGGVYTSTEYPSHYTLSLHNELSYTYRSPEHLFFYCVKAAEQGGETPLGDSRWILANIDREVVNQFKNKGIKYVRNLHGDAGSGYSWQEAFETDDKSVVENICRAGVMDFRWKDDGGLHLSEVRPATAKHSITGEEVWFNQADGFHPSAIDPETYKSLISTMAEEEFRLNAYFGDGTMLDSVMLNHIREVMRKKMVLVSWMPGDILIVDNKLTCHGRMPFTGSRRILLAMT
jgi:alpha-ketoglutarate-dependent taurine dioxygenase